MSGSFGEKSTLMGWEDSVSIVGDSGSENGGEYLVVCVEKRDGAIVVRKSRIFVVFWDWYQERGFP